MTRATYTVVWRRGGEHGDDDEMSCSGLSLALMFRRLRGLLRNGHPAIILSITREVPNG